MAKRAQSLSSIQPNVNENSPVMAWNEWDPLEEVNTGGDFKILDHFETKRHKIN